MATYAYDSLKKKYGNFSEPKLVIRINENELTNEKKGFPVGDVVLDLTSGYEASVAEFSIYNVYDLIQNEFLFDSVKKYIYLGSKVEIELGYKMATTLTFLGIITRVNFMYEKEGIPCIRVTAMDVKGVMMSGSYDKQLKATNYADAVTEILTRTAYEKLKDSGVIQKISVQDTADKLREKASGVGTDVTGKTIEMVSESDYEFVVKVAKRNNFEFYTECGEVKFRKAKSDQNILLELTPAMSLRSFDISYDITGIVEKVIVRGMDVSKAKLIKTEKKLSNTISQGNKAKSVIKGSQKVYIDATVDSKEEADTRAESLMEKIAYRYGSMYCELIGIPELQPGHFIHLYGLGTGADNIFYLQRVKHVIDENGKYEVMLEGVSDSIGQNNLNDFNSMENYAGLDGLNGLGSLSALF